MNVFRRLSNQQRTFLGMIRDGMSTLEGVQNHMGLDPRLMARWLENPAFCAALRTIMKAVRRRYRLRVQMLGGAAAAKMGELVQRGGAAGDLVQVEACGRSMEETQRAEAATRRRKGAIKPDVPETRNLRHPDVEDKGDLLLAELARLDRADTKPTSEASAEEVKSA